MLRRHFAQRRLLTLMMRRRGPTSAACWLVGGIAKEAVFQFQKAVQLNPAEADAHADYAVALIQMQRLPEAEREAEAAVKADPKSSRTHDLLAAILAQKGLMNSHVQSSGRR